MPWGDAHPFVRVILDLDELDIDERLDKPKERITEFVQFWNDVVKVEFSRAVIPCSDLPIFQFERRAVLPIIVVQVVSISLVIKFVNSVVPIFFAFLVGCEIQIWVHLLNIRSSQHELPVIPHQCPVASATLCTLLDVHFPSCLTLPIIDL